MRKKFKWDPIYLYWGITAFLVIVCSITFFLALSGVESLKAAAKAMLNASSAVLIGLVFAYMLNKIMTFFENTFLFHVGDKLFPGKPRRAQKVKRIISLTLTMTLAIGFLCGSVLLLLPQLYKSGESLLNMLPGYFTRAVEVITKLLDDNPEIERAAVNLVGDIKEWLTNWIQTAFLGQIDVDALISNIFSGVVGALKAVLNIAVGLVISIYVLYHKEKFGAQSKKIVYSMFKTKTANKIVKGVHFTDKTCGSFITSKVIDSLIVGGICYLFMAVLGMPYAILISVLIGVTNIIPFFGPFIGGIPSAALIFLENPTQCLIFIIFIIVLQQIDGNIIYPKIQGNSLGLSGFWIVFSILIFGGIFGFWGMLFGVPVFALIYAAAKGMINTGLKSRELPTSTDEFENIMLFDDETHEPIYKEPVKAPGKKRSRSANTKDDGEPENDSEDETADK